jgi:hypothetical protein
MLRQKIPEADLPEKIADVLYSELIDQALFDPRIRRIGEFRSYRFDPAGDFPSHASEGRCFTLAVQNLLQGLVVLSDGNVQANVAATSRQLVRHHATTGSDEIEALEQTARCAANIFMQPTAGPTTPITMTTYPVGQENLLVPGAYHAGEEETLYTFAFGQRTHLIGFNRRNDANAMELTVMRADGRVADRIASAM